MRHWMFSVEPYDGRYQVPTWSSPNLLVAGTLSRKLLIEVCDIITHKMIGECESLAARKNNLNLCNVVMALFAGVFMIVACASWR